MLQLQRVTKVISGIEFELLTDENNAYYFTEANLEKNLQTGERSIRDFLVGKSPEALRCKNSLSGKLAKIQGYNKSVKVYDLIVVENYLAYQARKLNEVAIVLQSEFVGLGLYTWCATAFGRSVDVVVVDNWTRAREAMSKEFPELCKWHKADLEAGVTTAPYVAFVVNFKRDANLETIKPGEMSAEQLRRYEKAMAFYETCRKIGMTDKQAREKLRMHF